MKTKYTELSKKLFNRYILFLYAIMFCNASFAEDPLSQVVKTQVRDLFGPGSTVAYCIYIAEIILGSVIYIKTRNLLTLIGVPVIVAFTTAMFKFIATAGT